MCQARCRQVRKAFIYSPYVRMFVRIAVLCNDVEAINGDNMNSCPAGAALTGTDTL